MSTNEVESSRRAQPAADPDEQRVIWFAIGVLLGGTVFALVAGGPDYMGTAG